MWRICVASWAAGDIEKDFWYTFDLLRNPKDHVEFTLVRDWVRDALSGVCSVVSVDREKSVLKQGAVQHLYGRLSGQLKPNANDAHLLVRPCCCQTVQGRAICLHHVAAAPRSQRCSPPGETLLLPTCVSCGGVAASSIDDVACWHILLVPGISFLYVP